MLTSITDWKILSNKKKSHTCEEGAHLRISFWYLLTNLKNKLLLKKLLKWANKTKIKKTPVDINIKILMI